MRFLGKSHKKRFYMANLRVSGRFLQDFDGLTSKKHSICKKLHTEITKYLDTPSCLIYPKTTISKAYLPYPTHSAHGTFSALPLLHSTLLG